MSPRACEPASAGPSSSTARPTSAASPRRARAARARCRPRCSSASATPSAPASSSAATSSAASTARPARSGTSRSTRTGPICRCSNRGCLETYAGGPALLSLFPPGEGMQRLGDLLQAAEAGDGSARRVIADAGRHIGVALASLCNLFDPGADRRRRRALAGRARSSWRRCGIRSSAPRSPRDGGLPEIIGASFGEWAETRGAIAIALDHVTVEAEAIPFSA